MRYLGIFFICYSFPALFIIYIFAQPTVGNLPLAKALESIFPHVQYLRVNQAGDLVQPVLPGAHAGIQVLVPGKGPKIPRPSN